MYRTLMTVSILLAAMNVDSVSFYSFRNIYIVNAPDLAGNKTDLADGNYKQSVEKMKFEELSDAVSGPPPHIEVAKMARYIVHNSDWTVIAYRSQHAKTNDFPMGSVLSVSDGPVDNGKGVAYVYVSEVEDAIQDLHIDNRCSLTMTLAQGNYCVQEQLDPQYPTCAQVTLVGRLVKVNDSTEQAFAKEALFTRHPSMKTWPKDHDFFFMKLNIEQVVVQDYFGGPIYVSPDDYLNATP